MKTVFKSLALAAIVAASFTACHTEGEPTKIVVNNVVRTSSKILVVNANVDATFTFGGQTQNGTTARFETNANTGVVTVTADGRRAVTLNIDFNGGEYLEYDVVLATKGDTFVAAEAEADGAAPVSNGEQNAEENDGVTAEFSVAGNSNTGTTGDYSITVFTPTDTDNDVENAEKNSEINEAVLGLDCKPDGAVFETPIVVTVNIPGSDGFDITCVGENKEEAQMVRTGDKAQVTLEHFSVWEFVLKAIADVITTDIQTSEYSGNAATGVIEYKFKYGYENSDNASLIAKYLKKLFGVPAKERAKKVTFDKKEGTARLKVEQQVKTYTFSSGTKTFTVKVFGKVTETLAIEAAPEVAPEIPTHNGGGND